MAASQAEPSERAVLIRKTYAHLAGAILAFVALEPYGGIRSNETNLVHRPSPFRNYTVEPWSRIYPGHGRFGGAVFGRQIPVPTEYKHR